MSHFAYFIKHHLGGNWNLKNKQKKANEWRLHSYVGNLIKTESQLLFTMVCYV